MGIQLAIVLSILGFLVTFFGASILIEVKEIKSILRENMSTTSTALAALQAQVAQNTNIEASAVTLIQGLAAQIAAAGTDPAALAALTASLNASATSLAAAITANTPATPAS